MIRTVKSAATARWLLLWMGLCAGAAVQAQTLQEAVQAAWARTPQAAALASRQVEAQAASELAGNLTPGPPSLSVSNYSDRLYRKTGSYEWELELATPLWLPGQRQAREAVAGKAATELDAKNKTLRLQLAAEVREAWWSLAYAQDAAALAQQRLASAKALEDSVQRRFKAGELARLDANMAQSETLSAESESLAADAGLQQVQHAWRSLVGLPPPAVLGAEAVQTSADMTNHPQLRNLQAAAELARSRLSLVDASGREAPELSLRWSTQRAEYGAAPSQILGFKLTVPFSSQTRRRQEEAAARAEIEHAEAELAVAQSRLELDLQKTQAELNLTGRQLSLAANRRTLADDSLQLARRAFTLGESDLATFLRARAAALEAETQFRRQQTARNQALSRLYQAQGNMP